MTTPDQLSTLLATAAHAKVRDLAQMHHERQAEFLAIEDTAANNPVLFAADNLVAAIDAIGYARFGDEDWERERDAVEFNQDAA